MSAVAGPGPARADPPHTTATERTLPADYADRVNDMLNDKTDRWGEKLIAGPDGPTYENIKPLLMPANGSDGQLTASHFYYLPFTYPKPDPRTAVTNRQYSLHVADGSQIVSQWEQKFGGYEHNFDECPAGQQGDIPQCLTFGVGSGGTEIYGSDRTRLAEPKLTGDYLPILALSYTDAQGVRYDRESFTARDSQTNALVSHVKFDIQSSGTAPTIRIRIVGPDLAGATLSGNRLVKNGRTFLAYSGTATWQDSYLTLRPPLSSGKAEVYLAILNENAAATSLQANSSTWTSAKNTISTYWQNVVNGGAKVEVPEKYAADAMRNLLMQNLVMGWQQSIGNAYEAHDDTFAFVPEVGPSIEVLGDFGFASDYRTNMDVLVKRGQGPDTFLNWERGIKLQNAAYHYFQSNDASFIRNNLTTFRSFLTEYARQRAADPNGLLEKQQYGTDIDSDVYGVHHQAEAWRGIRDMGNALRQMGETAIADQFATQANGLRTALLNAVTASEKVLPDGSIFLPISLLDPNAPAPYDQITKDTLGSYWNLTMPFVMATGLIEPGSARAAGIHKYLNKHGALMLGLTRFNATGVDPGVCESGQVLQFAGGAAGYKSSGVDQQYGYSLQKFLADNDQADRLALSFYGKLAQDLTPYTFIGGEGATVAPCPEQGEYNRTQWWPPLSGNNAMYLKALRLMLVREQNKTNGMPGSLNLASATPRGWLASGKRINIADMPTAFGPVSYSIESDLANNTVRASVTPPVTSTGRVRADAVTLRLRVPDGYRMASATVNGASHAFDATTETIDLGQPTATANIVVTYTRNTPAHADQAEATVVKPGRKLFAPGQKVRFDTTIEALGESTVPGTLTISGSGLPASADTSFSVTSNRRLAWQKVGVEVTMPTAPGQYTLDFVADPADGPPTTRKVTVRVAQPSATSYPDLVRSALPAGYWRLGELNGNPVAADSSGRGNDGAYREFQTHEVAGAIADDTDTALQLDNGFVEVPNNPAMNFTGPFTLESWIKVTTSTEQALIEKYDAPANNGYLLRLRPGNKLRLVALDGGDDPVETVGKTTVQPGSWHHVAATFTGSRLSVYLDGALDASIASTRAATGGNSTLKIGARGDDAGQRLAGSVDEVAVYPSALSAQQIDDHFVRGALGRNTTGTQANRAVIGQDFPDPSVLAVDGTYYAYATNNNEKNMPVASAPSPDGPWTFQSADGLPSLPSWAGPGNTWAPDVTRRADGTYLLYLTAKHNASGLQCVGAATATSPRGPFTPVGSQPLVCPTDRSGAIDASAFVDSDGARYLLWKTDENRVGANPGLYIQRTAADGLSLQGSATRLLQVDRPDEHGVIESPNLVKQDGRYVLFYSTGPYGSPLYSTSYATASSVTGPYVKAFRPLLTTDSLDGAVRGPGGGVLLRGTASQPGDRFMFHGWLPTGGRGMYTAEIGWSGGYPVARGSRVRYEAERGRINHATVRTGAAGSSGEGVVGGLDFDDSWTEVDVFAPVAGDYTVHIGYANGSSGPARQELTVNGGAASAVTYPVTGWDNWRQTGATVRLRAGTNTIRLRHVDQFAEIDYLEVA
ncbi:family 43 glycosylhydrolase [Actinoplanes sp. NPDC089786]|uniref:family 43 glycosylhydrolase n=1 Tax=Actinoplanes sp. NPDC089786 TaxID=3155185 RepID=UPI003435C08E